MIGLTSNIEEVIQRFKIIRDRANNLDPTDALIAGVNAARGQMSNRIFNQGLDANGVPFGKYVGKKRNKLTARAEKVSRTSRIDLFGNQSGFSPYELKRLAKGRQIVFKDLEFYGDLRRGIKTIRENENRVVCAIPNDALLRIAISQQLQIGRIRGGGEARIFTPSKTELELMNDTVREILKQQYVRVLNS